MTRPAAPVSPAAKVERELRLEQREDGQLWAMRGGDEQAVHVVRSFPWTDPTRFISLRDGDEEEFALVRDPRDLDPTSREALEHALAEAGFVLEIIGIDHVDEEVEIRTWKVRTAQGPRSFQTRRDEWPREVPGGGVVVRDVAGDLFYVRDPHGLDDKSRALLWVFVD